MPIDTINDAGIAHMLRDAAANDPTCVEDTTTLPGDHSPDGFWRMSYHLYKMKTHYIVDVHEATVHICESEEEACALMLHRKREAKLEPVRAMQAAE